MVPAGRQMALTVAAGQAGLGDTVCSPVLADTGCAGIGLPASPLGPGPAQPPALGGSWVALTGLQLRHPALQVLVLGKRWGWEALVQPPPPFPTAYESQGRMRRKLVLLIPSSVFFVSVILSFNSAWFFLMFLTLR